MLKNFYCDDVVCSASQSFAVTGRPLTILTTNDVKKSARRCTNTWKKKNLSNLTESVCVCVCVLYDLNERDVTCRKVRMKNKRQSVVNKIFHHLRSVWIARAQIQLLYYVECSVKRRKTQSHTVSDCTLHLDWSFGQIPRTKWNNNNK